MGIMMVVAPIGEYDEELDDEGREAAAADIEGLNEILTEAGLPEYHDPLPESEEGSIYWNQTWSAGGLDSLFAMIQALSEQDIPGVQWDILSHPEVFPILYLPIEFEGVVEVNSPEGGCGDEECEDCDDCGDDADTDSNEHACGCGEGGCGSHEEGDAAFGLASSHELRASIEALAQFLELPLDRFETDFSGDGSDVEEAWEEIFDELEENGARCMNLEWDQEPMTPEGVRAYAQAMADHLGINADEILESLAGRYGSIEEAAAALEEENDPETLARTALASLINFYHASVISIENNVPVRFS